VGKVILHDYYVIFFLIIFSYFVVVFQNSNSVLIDKTNIMKLIFVAIINVAVLTPSLLS